MTSLKDIDCPQWVQNAWAEARPLVRSLLAIAIKAVADEAIKRLQQDGMSEPSHKARLKVV